MQWSRRDRALIDLLLRRQTADEIARQLDMSEREVQYAVNSILRKFRQLSES